MKERTFFSKLGLFFLLLAFLVNFLSCKKDNQDVVPYVPVNLILDLQTDLAHLGVGETATITRNNQGFGVIRFTSPNYPSISLGQEVYGNGLILYRISIYEFAVYDKTCTFRASTDNCAVEMDDTGLIPECPCCHSQFIIPLDGSVKQGPAALPLKAYPSFVRNNQLIISN